MLILIRWLHQKPADLDLQCFPKKRINSGSAGQELIKSCNRSMLRSNCTFCWLEEELPLVLVNNTKRYMQISTLV